MRKYISDLMKLSRWCAILVILLVLSGCASSTHRVRREKLSDAMAKASDEHEGDRTVSRPKYSYNDDDDDKHVDHIIAVHHRPDAPSRRRGGIPGVDLPDESVEQESDYSRTPLLFSVTWAGLGQIHGDEELDGISALTLGIGTYDDRQQFEGTIGGGRLSLDKGSYLASSIKGNPWFFSLGLDYKLFTNSLHAFTRPYLLIGAAYNHLFWTYENALVEWDGEEFDGDSLGGAELHAGVGINLAQTRDFQLGIEVVGRLMGWLNETYNDFENDVFDSFSALNFRITCTFL